MSELSTLALDRALLGFLVQSPRHGYELYATFRRELGDIWQAGRSQVYALLHRLAGQGLVQATPVLQEGRPPRRVYALTDAGRIAFLAWLHAPVPHMRDIRVELLAKLYFCRLLDPDATADLLARQIALCRRRLEALDAAALAARDARAVAALAASYRRQQVIAIIQWLEECQQQAEARG